MGAVKQLLLACALAVLLAWPGAAGAAGFHDADGLHVVSVKQVDPRLMALVVTTKALPKPANVYVLLPPDYAAHPQRRWPVFYLLHGTSGTASDWTKQGDAEKVIGNRELITVMPDIALDDGGGGWCTDWPGGAQSWETFHIRQLIPWVDDNLRTRPTRGERAIAGLSQGGFCSMSYAARHPDLFATALAYSGAPEIYHDPDARLGAMAIINGTEVGLDQVPPNTFFGDQFTNGINWAAHDPASIAQNLRDTRMYLYWGDGRPGPLDSDPVSPLGGQSEIEAAVARSNTDFQARLADLRIPAVFDPYGAGTHAWPYWKRDLGWSIDRVMTGFAHPAPKPARFTFTSADDRYGVYGWTVTMRRSAREFSTLGGASCRGFSLAGSGSGLVTTAPCFTPGRRYRVALDGPHVRRSAVVTGGRSRRLTLDVPLGPANPYQQETAEAQAAGTAVYTTYVTITGLR